MTNKQPNTAKTETLIKVKRSLFILTLCLSGTLTGRFLHVYTDYKKHPAMYTAPYPTWLEKLDMDFMIYGIGILICIVVVTALTIILRKTKNRQG
ncbi:MAG: hypothetical protein IJD31_08100 [Lachnospiraceae bacterium]|nr:hypothetical protein [Lachnospiraceae bacterium]